MVLVRRAAQELDVWHRPKPEQTLITPQPCIHCTHYFWKPQAQACSVIVAEIQEEWILSHVPNTTCTTTFDVAERHLTMYCSSFSVVTVQYTIRLI